MSRRFFTFLLSALACTFFMGVPAGAFKTFHDVGPWGIVHVGGTIHQNISSAGLAQFGISEASFQSIDDGNTGQDDVTHYNFTNAPFHHFDDCTIRQGMAYVSAQREQAVSYAANAPTDPEAKRNALEAVGELLHTAQDFYSHMNYVELALKANPSLRPDQIPIVDWSHLPTGLRSGYFFWRGYSNNEITVDRDAAIRGLTEDEIQGNFLSTAALFTSRRTFEEFLDYATNASIQVLHADLNKDGPNEPEGRVVVPSTGITLHAYAVNLAIRETERQWREFEAAIRRAQTTNATAILRALKGGGPIEPRHVSVLVKNHENSSPLANARITFGDLSATSNAEGRGVLVSPPGRFPLLVSADDYEPAGPIYLEVLEGQDPAEQPMLLTPARSYVRITVKDHLTDQPISGAEVTFHNEEGSRGINVSGTTGSDGSGRLRPTRGPWTVWTTAHGYHRDETEFDVGRSNDYTLEVALDPEAVPVSIFVMEKDGGAPIRGAVVTLGGEARSTDGDGEAFFPTTPGAYAATASAPGRLPGSASFTVVAGAGHRETILLAHDDSGADSEPGATTDSGGNGLLVVTVLGEHDEPQAAIALTVAAPTASGANYAITYYTDATGQASIPYVGPIIGATITSSDPRPGSRYDGATLALELLPGRTERITIRMTARTDSGSRCTDAEDQAACAATLGGMCPCEHANNCRMITCLYESDAHDTRPPSRPAGRIFFTSPENGSTTTSGVITVTGRTEDFSGTSIVLDVNGSPRVVPLENGNFSSQVPVIRGKNVIQARAGELTSAADQVLAVLEINAQIASAAIWSELTWNTTTDVDLHLYLPNGEHCYYNSHPTPARADLDIDNTNAYGPEHITMPTAIPGQYRLTVLYYNPHGSDPTPPTNWSVTLRLNDGAVSQTFSGTLTSSKEEQTVTTFQF